VSVLNVNYDQQQTGANLQETALQPGINWSNFGKVGTFAVDGQVYAQPLYVPGVTIAGKQYNVLYVVTQHNGVYAFNADTPQVPTPLWQVNLGPIVPSGLFNFGDIVPEIGILGTPVIDPVSQVLYVVSDMLPTDTTTVPIFRLHALSLVDGHEMIRANGREHFAVPVPISATVQGTGAGSSGGSVPFDAFWHLQRPGLMLSNGTLYISFGSHADTGDYHGWLMAYEPGSLRLKSVFNTTPNGRQSAIWQSGRGPAFDSKGDVYVTTGNGDWDGQANFGESILHLSGTDLSLKDWYTPEEWSDLNDSDQDLGSAGAIFIPNTNYLLVGGKTGLLHLVQAGSLGHLAPDNTSTLQSVQVNAWGIFTMVLWPQANPIVYEFDPAGTLKAFQIVNNQINSTILSQFSPTVSSTYCGLSLSANGSQNGIVWLTTGNPDKQGVPGTVHALDATDLSNELWNSDLAAGNRDTLGRLAKFAVPTVANGRVYVPTFSNSVEVYGVLGSSTAPNTGLISAVTNSASLLEGPVSPGELVTIFGANIGPVAQTSAVAVNQRIPTTVGGTSVLFDGTPAPVLSTSSDQIMAVVPFGVAGPTSKIQVTYQGNTVAATTVPVQAATPAIFAQNGSGGGIGSILNQDGTTNTTSNGAKLGSVVSMFATGGGATTPASQDGVLASPPYPAFDLQVSVTIAGAPATIVSAGPAPGMVAGMMQIQFMVPDDAWVSPFDPLVLTVGNYSSPDGVWMVVVQ
jgi:uncharacterized protein (TIGR03437 family)